MAAKGFSWKYVLPNFRLWWDRGIILQPHTCQTSGEYTCTTQNDLGCKTFIIHASLYTLVI